MIALVRTVEGVFEVDVENEDVLGAVDAAVDRERPELVNLEEPRLRGLLEKSHSLVLVRQPFPPAGKFECQVVRFAARAARG